MYTKGFHKAQAFLGPESSWWLKLLLLDIILGGLAASNGQDWVEGKTPSNGRKETILTILGQDQTIGGMYL